MLRQDACSSRHSQSRQTESSQSNSGINQVLPNIITKYCQEPEQQQMLSFIESLMADITVKDQQLIALYQQIIALNKKRNEEVFAKNQKIFELENQLRQFKLRELNYE
ncbi:Hypothetical_protein [Hexamita inflata]|uniref:Hypothetical_protein n=1 Tax=Hexamita inflata TaxID=28002 RepID=A0AA86UWM3_9EUKA|nr:Hypothetical protein HINF_LOCUS58544 [Hexamita inflata]